MGEIADGSLPDNVLFFYEFMLPVPGIPGIVPVIPQHEVAVSGNGVGAEISQGSFGCKGIVQRLGGMVDVDLAVYNGYSLAGKADDSLDIKDGFIVGIPENNNIISLGNACFVCKAASYDAISRHNGIFHGFGGNPCVYD